MAQAFGSDLCHQPGERRKIKSGNGRKKKAVPDGNYNSYWTTKSGDNTAMLELDLRSPKTFDLLLLKENITVGQRIEGFVFEYSDGGEWKKATEGTTAGYKRSLGFDPAIASKLRLRILSSHLNPTLSEIGLHKRVEKE